MVKLIEKLEEWLEGVRFLVDYVGFFLVGELETLPNAGMTDVERQAFVKGNKFALRAVIRLLKVCKINPEI